MTEEQKRQWAIITWYVQETYGDCVMLGYMMAISSISSDDIDEILKIKNSFTEQPKP